MEADRSTPSEHVPRRGVTAWLGVAVRGMAMGVAEVVPGVSGGTVAFITGIYDELVRTFAGLGPSSVPALRHPAKFWTQHNLSFLLVLGLGMVLAVALFARLMHTWLEQVPQLVWGFFFGLITASVVLIGRRRAGRQLLFWGLPGIALGVAVTMLPAASANPAPLAYFLGGAVAVCAWLLPAISGSFVLLLLGLYEPVLAALAAFEVTTLLILGAGCVTGLLLFSRLLNWLMHRFREPVMCLLTGFLAGALLKLWPWQVAGVLRSPEHWSVVTGADAALIPVMLCCLAGMGALWLLSLLDR